MNDIIKLESKDSQFLSLKNARSIISKKSKNKTLDQNIFLFLILQNGLISYQIAGSGENRREEFSQKISKDRNVVSKRLIEKKDNIDRRYNFLTTSKYNKRIYNIKKSRLNRFQKFLDNINFQDNKIFHNYYKDMYGLLKTISQIMDRPIDSKTLTFTIKMFGYGSRIVYKKTLQYPQQISIPIDSRLKKIYQLHTNKTQENNTKEKKLIKIFFKRLSDKCKIAPLHLDSILRTDYRNKHIKNKLLLNGKNK